MTRIAKDFNKRVSKLSLAHYSHHVQFLLNLVVNSCIKKLTEKRVEHT